MPSENRTVLVEVEQDEAHMAASVLRDYSPHLNRLADRLTIASTTTADPEPLVGRAVVIARNMDVRP